MHCPPPPSAYAYYSIRPLEAQVDLLHLNKVAGQ